MKIKFTSFVLIFSGFVFSQEKINTSVLEKIAKDSKFKYEKELAEFSSKLNSSSSNKQKLIYQFAGFELGMPIIYQTTDSNQARTTNTDLLYNNSIPGVQVTGEGMNVYIWDGGSVRPTHNELSGRITNKNAVPFSPHSTGVAGVVMGEGVANFANGANSRGMAFEADLISYDYANSITEISTESANVLNADYMISNHSYGAVVGWIKSDYGNGEGWYWFGYPYYSETESVYFGYYGGDDASLDQISYNSPQHIIVKSAGNDNHEGPDGTVPIHWSGSPGNWIQHNNVFRPKDCGQTGFDCIPTSSLAKNIITVGAVEMINGRYTQPSDVVAGDFTSFGPADDGRIKPDVVAVGVEVIAPGSASDSEYYSWRGTSFSAPAVTGNIVLLEQLYHQNYGEYLRSDLAKALVVHTANEAGDAPGPDYKFGWGLMNTAEAAEVIMGKDQTTILDTHTLNNGDNYTLNVRGIENTPLKVTIVWLDPKANVGGGHNDRTPQLINDLDLRINDGIIEYFPWKLDVYNPAAAATRGDNVLDNVEQIIINNPVEGLNYQISISHKGNLQFGSQVFAIVVSGAAFCSSTTTWDGLAWSNGLPDLNKKAIIDGELILNSDLSACELELTSNGKLEIPSGFNFTVKGLINNQSAAANFIVHNDANLIQIENTPNIGSITVLRDSNPMRRLDYTFWSSPVMDQNLFGFSPETVNGVTNYPGSTGRIYVYNGANGYENPNPYTAETAMNPAVGYLFRSPNNYDATQEVVFEGTFSGVPTNGNQTAETFPGSYTSVGNPYASNLDADAFFAANPQLETLYFWNNNHNAGNNYATCVSGECVAAAGGGVIPNGTISVGQGFLVKTSGTAVNFDNNMRTTDQGAFSRNPNIEKHRFRLNLNDEQGNGFNQILVSYTANATNGIDHQIDGKQFSNAGSSLYNLIEEDKFVIQGRALPFENTDMVSLGFKAEEAGRFQIVLDSFDGLFAEGQTIYLKDKELNIQHNLSESTYEFESEAGEFNERFKIVYKTAETMGNEELEFNLIQIYTQNQNIIIDSKSDKILSVELYDLSGRNLFRNEKVNSNHYEFQSVSKGVLVVKVQTESGKVENRKVVLN